MPNSRSLTAGETQWLNQLFSGPGHKPDWSKVEIHTQLTQPFRFGNQAQIKAFNKFTPAMQNEPNKIFYETRPTNNHYSEDFSSAHDLKFGTFIHEAGHLWQRANGIDPLRGYVSGTLSNGFTGQYDAYDPSKKFKDQHTETQGNAFRDYAVDIRNGRLESANKWVSRIWGDEYHFHPTNRRVEKKQNYSTHSNSLKRLPVINVPAFEPQSRSN